LSIHRRNARRDANEPEIRQALKDIGANVYQVSGKGLPDLIVIFRGRAFLLEVKTETGELTDPQSDFMKANADCEMVGVVRNVDEALRLIGVT
jgi:hypothetical protein